VALQLICSLKISSRVEALLAVVRVQEEWHRSFYRGGQVRARRLNTRPDWSTDALYKPEIAQNGPGTAEHELSQVGSILSPQAPAASGGVDLSSIVGACGGQVCKIGAQHRASHASHVRSRPGLALCRSFERYTAHAPRG
jgi:hypothetical protein